jgi:hypothetical protein
LRTRFQFRSGLGKSFSFSNIWLSYWSTRCHVLCKRETYGDCKPRRICSNVL